MIEYLPFVYGQVHVMDYDKGNTNAQAEKKARGAYTISERSTAHVSALPMEREGCSFPLHPQLPMKVPQRHCDEQGCTLLSQPCRTETEPVVTEREDAEDAF